MSGKRNEIELYEDRAKVAELMHRGTTSPSQIMDIINSGRPKNKCVSRQTIANDIEWLKQQYRESALYDFNEAWHQTLAQYNDLLKVAWNEFYASRTVKVTITTEGRDEAATDADEFDAIMQGHGAGQLVTADSLLDEARAMKSIVKKEQREGSVAYLQLIERIIEKIAKMKGVDGTSKIALTNAQGQDLPSVVDGVIDSLKKINLPTEEDFIEVEPELLTEGTNEPSPDSEI